MSQVSQAVVCPLATHNPDCAGADLSPPAVVKPQQYAVVRLDVGKGDFPIDWAPRSAQSVPKQEWQGVPAQFVAQTALAFNARDDRKARWMVALVDNHGGMVRVHIPIHQRPTDPAALPPDSLTFDDCRKARQHAYGLNAAILDVARVPRHWYVVAHVLPKQEGGAA